MDTSVYVYIRYITVFCAVLGNFYAIHIEDEDLFTIKLKYKYFPFTVFCFQMCIAELFFIYVILNYLKSRMIAICIANLALLSVHSVWMTAQIVGSKQVVLAFQSTVKLRHYLSLSTYLPKNYITNPTVFSATLLALLLAFHLSIFTLGDYELRADDRAWLTDIYFILSICFPYRQCTMFSCVYYSCALVVYDTVQVWRRQSKVRPLQAEFLSSFCSLISNQAQVLAEIDGLLQNQVLSLLVYRGMAIVSNGAHFIEQEGVITSNIFYLIVWSIFLGLVFLTMSLALDEYKKMTQEVFLMPTKDILKQEYPKVRVLLAHLDNKPGVFTVGGFVEGGPPLLMTFTALGIEFIITLFQNIDVLRTLMVLTP